MENAPVVAARIGWDNVVFRRGRIQDLALDMDALDGWLAEHPVRGAKDLAALDEAQDHLRRTAPLVADASVDVVVSNCVLNPWDANQAVLYAGPWKQVEDDDGHVLRRGERVAVCEKTFRILTGAAYADAVIAIEPLVPVPEDARLPFDCARTVPRHPRETKGMDYDLTTDGACTTPGCC